MKLKGAHLLAMLFLIQALAAAYKAYDSFRTPFPYWMMATRWYEFLAIMVNALVIAALCVVYLYRVKKYDPLMKRSAPMRWRNRIELRLGLYSYTTFVLVVGPLLGIFKTIQAVRHPDPFSHDTFWSLFPYSDLIAGLIIGSLIILYDRHRLREDRLCFNECLRCGYDLRATPERCPECGTVPLKIGMGNSSL
jgi:hypothetical protein